MGKACQKKCEYKAGKSQNSGAKVVISDELSQSNDKWMKFSVKGNIGFTQSNGLTTDFHSYDGRNYEKLIYICVINLN
jgi:hypothetical protein